MLKTQGVTLVLFMIFLLTPYMPELTHTDYHKMAHKVASTLHLALPEYAKPFVSVEDLAQEAMAAGYRSARSYRTGGSTKLSTYVYTCMLNHTRSVVTFWHRNRRFSVACALEEDAHTVEYNPSEQRDAVAEFIYVLRCLTPRTRALFLLLIMADSRHEIRRLQTYGDLVVELRFAIARTKLSFDEFLGIYRDDKLRKRIARTAANWPGFMQAPALEPGEAYAA